MKKTEHFENDDGTCETCIEIGKDLGFSDALKEVEKEIDNLKRKNPKGVPWISAPELKQHLEKLRGAGK